MKSLRLFKFKLALTFLVLVSCKTTNQNEIKELEGHYDMMQQQFQAIRDMMGGM